MNTAKRYLLRYFLPFCLIYGMLLGGSYLPAIRDGLLSHARQRADKVLTTFFPKAIFISDPKKIKNTNQRDDIITLLFSNRAIVDEQLQEKFAKKTAPTAKVGNFKALNYKVDEIFIMPFVFFFALLLITPITWKRKLIAGTIGFAALTLFQIGFICTLAWDKISNAKIGVYELSTEQYQWLDRLNAPLATSGIILIPVLIWAMVSFRKDDWQQLKLFS
ncbi:MAG: hypothetical protein AAF806_00650 [Bacteroidota bacterium]